jgi:hypothetical protein
MPDALRISRLVHEGFFHRFPVSVNHCQVGAHRAQLLFLGTQPVAVSGDCRMQRGTLVPPTITLFLEPKLFRPFVVGTTSLAIFAMALYDFLKDLVNAGEFHWRFPLLGVVSFLFMLMAAHLFKKRYIEVTHITPPKSPPAPKKKGLVVLGSDQAVVQKAIEHHGSTLKYAWIIASEQTKGMATAVKGKLQSTDRAIEVQVISNPGDWHGVSLLVRDLLEHNPRELGAGDIIVDLTGLTKPASIGAFLGALQAGGLIQYTPGKYTTGPQGRTIEPLEPVQIVINYSVVQASAAQASAGQNNLEPSKAS